MPEQLNSTLAKSSRAFFFATIVLLPFRYRFLQITRPIEPIWSDYTDFILYASDVALLLTLATWLLHLYLHPRRLQTGPAFLTLPLVGLTLAALVTSATSIDPALAFYHSIRLIILFAFYLYVINQVTTIRQLLAPLSVMLSIQASIAILQALTQRSVGLQSLGEFELNPAWSGISVVWTESIRALRAYGLTDHPNLLAGCLVFAMLLLLVWHLFEGQSMDPLTFTFMAMGALALFFTYSRSAWLALFVALIFIGYHRFVRQKRLPAWKEVAFFLALLLMLFPFIWANIELVGLRLGEQISFQELQPELGSLQERRVLASAGNTVFVENAILGVGLGASPQAFMKTFPSFPVNYAPVHNVVLSAALETGLFGGLFYLTVIAAPWFALFLNRRIKYTPDLIAATAALLALAVVGLFDVYPWLLAPGRLWQYLAWGLWARFYVDAQNKAKA
ncbi:MAG TPA: O-antigen ligase family protein [Anaerolineales bacterium]|nr:O-antigen ligase family protein [Anaerolineales bacterium]